MVEAFHQSISLRMKGSCARLAYLQELAQYLEHFGLKMTSLVTVDLVCGFE